MALILKDCLAPEISSYKKLSVSNLKFDITGGALDVVIVPVLAGSDALLGSVVLDTLESLQLEVGTHLSLSDRTNEGSDLQWNIVLNLRGHDVSAEVSEE